MEFDEEVDQRIHENVRRALSKSPHWQPSEFLHLNTDQWVPVAEAIRNVPGETGLYALGLVEGLRYEKGISRIVYIGSAKNLKNRLRMHHSASHNDVVELIRHKMPGSLVATWWPIPEFDRKFLYGIEGEAIMTFEAQFGMLPVCNFGVPEFFEGEDYCSGLTRIGSCDVVKPLTLGELARILDRKILRKDCHRGFSFSINLDGDSFEIGDPKSNRVEFVRHDEVPIEVGQKSDEEEMEGKFEEQMRLWDLSLIHDENLAAWSGKKMRQVIDLCRKLSPRKTRAKAMKPFDAPMKEVPHPHTWGEVALIQARLISGSWQPGKQVWVKILKDNTLLGEAKLNKGWFVGEDKADLPQRETERPRWLQYKLPDVEMEFQEETETIYGLKITRRKFNETENHRLFEEKRKKEKEILWRHVDDKLQKAMNELNS